MELILTLAYSAIAISLVTATSCVLAFLKIQNKTKKKLAHLQEADTWIGELEPEAKELLQN